MISSLSALGIVGVSRRGRFCVRYEVEFSISLRSQFIANTYTDGKLLACRQCKINKDEEMSVSGDPIEWNRPIIVDFQWKPPRQ